jgi:hypothetical protein
MNEPTKSAAKQEKQPQTSVIGFGDFIPAFMLRAPVASETPASA